MFYKLLFFTVLLASNLAAANTSTDVETWIKRGAQLRREGDHAGALDAFLRAHTVMPSGRTWAQIGLARQSLHQWSESEICLQTALNGKEAWVERNRVALEAALGDVKKHIGWLLVKGTDGVKLSIDEVASGNLPLKEIRLDEGHHVVKAEQNGYETWVQTIEVEGGITKEVLVMLERAKPQIADSKRSGLDLTESRVPERSRALSLAGAGFLGAGLAVATVGTVIWIQQETGYFGTFNSGNTGAYLVAGGVAGMVLGSILMYQDRERSTSVGLTAMGAVVRGRF